MNKIVIIVPENYEVEPKDCPICKKAFSDKSDVVNYRVHGCCLKCDVDYRYHNREKWEKGWRPNN